jgi:hypothetical protein
VITCVMLVVQRNRCLTLVWDIKTHNSYNTESKTIRTLLTSDSIKIERQIENSHTSALQKHALAASCIV